MFKGLMPPARKVEILAKKCASLHSWNYLILVLHHHTPSFPMVPRFILGLSSHPSLQGSFPLHLHLIQLLLRPFPYLLDPFHHPFAASLIPLRSPLLATFLRHKSPILKQTKEALSPWNGKFFANSIHNLLILGPTGPDGSSFLNSKYLNCMKIR
jgi:hypothetical protein